MKRILILVLSLIMVLGIFTSVPVTVNAETIHTYGDFKYTFLSDGTIEIVDYTGGNNVIIPPIINGYTVSSIGESAFSKKHLSRVEIHYGITTIKNYAFSYNSNLSSVHIPNSVQSFGYMVFANSLDVVVCCHDGSYIDEIYKSWKSSNSSHTYTSDYHTVKAPTCTTTGQKAKYCIYCGITESTQIINSLGHTSSDWIIDENATCTGSGSKHKECTLCGVTIETETIPVKAHPHSDWIIETQATCIVNGLKYKKCTDCGVILVVESIPATGHTSVKDEAIEVTCTTPGKTEGSHCSVCNTVIVAQTTIPATGHTSSDWIIDSNATVSASGSKHIECTTCGEALETEVIPQLKPATPKVATANGLNGVNVTWNAVEGAVKYNVYHRQGGSNSWIYVGTTTGTSLTDTKVTSGIYYVYSVRAYNSAGQYSDFVNANTNTRKYMAVPKLTGISNATNGLYIKWNAVGGVTNGYRVYRRGAGSTYWTYLGTVKTTCFTDTSVKVRSGEYFRYTVIADGGYYSTFDTTGLFLKRLANPALISAVSSTSGITVKWEAVMGTTGYYVYRKTANSGWVRVAVVGGTNTTSYLDKTARKGVTYTYTVRAVSGATTSYFNSGISCYDKY